MILLAVGYWDLCSWDGTAQRAAIQHVVCIHVMIYHSEDLKTFDLFATRMRATSRWTNDQPSRRLGRSD